MVERPSVLPKVNVLKIKPMSAYSQKPKAKTAV